MKLIKHHALQEGVLLLLLCGALVWYSLDGYTRAFNKDWSQSPYLFPVILGGLLGILGLLTLLGGLRRGGKAAAPEKKHVPGGALRVLTVLGLSLLYYAALALVKLPYLAVTLGSVTLRFSTFEAATLLFVAGLMAYMGVRRRKLLVLVPIGTTVFLSVMFRSLLHVILP